MPYLTDSSLLRGENTDLLAQPTAGTTACGKSFLVVFFWARLERMRSISWSSQCQVLSHHASMPWGPGGCEALPPPLSPPGEPLPLAFRQLFGALGSEHGLCHSNSSVSSATQPAVYAYLLKNIPATVKKRKGKSFLWSFFQVRHTRGEYLMLVTESSYQGCRQEITTYSTA